MKHDDEEEIDEEFLVDEEFPLGDGTADTGALVTCPYCGEASEISLDPGSGATQEYIEDCPVCCRPWRLVVSYNEDGSAEASADAADDL